MVPIETMAAATFMVRPETLARLRQYKGGGHTYDDVSTS